MNREDEEVRNGTLRKERRELIKMKCVSCPFNDGLTEEATQAQNWGCLPTPSQMIDKADNHSIAISCHGSESVPCRGLAEHRDVEGMPVQSYSDWYRGDTDTV